MISLKRELFQTIIRERITRHIVWCAPFFVPGADGSVNARRRCVVRQSKWNLIQCSYECILTLPPFFVIAMVYFRVLISMVIDVILWEFSWINLLLGRSIEICVASWLLL